VGVDELWVRLFQYDGSGSSKPVWSFALDVGKRTFGAPCLDSAGNVYFIVEEESPNPASGDSYCWAEALSKLYLYSITNEVSPTLRWRKDISVGRTKCGGIPSPAVSVDDTIYAGNGAFFAFDTEGNAVWQFESPTADKKLDYMEILNSPLIDSSGNIYFNGLDVDDQPTSFLSTLPVPCGGC